MPPRLQPAGIRAVAEGVDKYVGDMKRMGGATADMGSRLSRMAEIAGGMLAAQVFSRLADAFMSVTRGAIAFGQEAVMTAARVQELDAVLGVIGERAGYSKDEMDTLVESIVDLGIRTDVAQTLLLKFSRYQLEMADATTLARLAQDAAVISMQDSSEALDGLIHGITTMNTRVLRTYGITLASVTDAQEVYAKSLGKTRDQLNETEMIQAVLNAVIKQGESIAGAYEAAMETAGKQMRSMGRHVMELKSNIGKPFLGAFSAVIKEVTTLIKHFRGITEEGTIFNRMLKAIASILTKVFIKAMNRMVEVFDLVMEHVANLWLAIESGRGVWGQLAMVFELFMNRVKPLHEEMLPRLIELFQRYLLPVIEKVMKAFVFFAQAIALGQGPIHAMIEALSVLVPKELVPAILKLHEKWDGFVSSIREFIDKHKDEIIAALKAIGLAITIYIITSEIIDGIRALGVLLNLLTDPIGLLLLAIGTLGIAWANNWGGIRDRLAEFWETTGRPIFEKIRTWLEENIPRAIETLASFWEGTLQPAIERVWLWVKESVFPIIQDLIAWLSEAIPRAIETAGTFWEETLRPAIERVWVWVKENVFPIIQELITWLSEQIPRAIETARAFWEETLQPALERVWTWVKENVFPIIEELIAWLGENIPIAIQKLSDFWTDTLWPAIENVWAWMKDHLFPFLGALADLVSAVLGKALEVLAGIWQNVLWPALQAFWAFLKEKLGPVIEWLGGIVETVFGVITAVMDALVEPFHLLADVFRNIKLPDWLISKSMTPLEEGLRGISDVMNELVKTRIPKLATEIANLPDWGGLQADFAPSVALSQQVMPAGGGVTRNQEFNLNVTTSATTEPIIADFQMLALLAELS